MKRPWLDNETKARLDAGLVKPIDAIFLFVVLATLLTCGFWAIFGSPTTEGILLVGIGLVAWVQIWLVFLVLRTAVFILQTRADVRTMPADAAQLVRAYAYGITPQAPTPGRTQPPPAPPGPPRG